MAPKQEVSKKAKKEKAARTVEDATFGLKNKNKSAKVKTFIDRVEKGVKQSTGFFDAEAAKEAKKAAKLAKQLQEEELRILFNEGIMNQFGKKKSATAARAAELGIAEQSKEVAELLEEFSSDSDTDVRDNDKRQTIYLSDDDEPVEIFREKTIEDIIEEQRAKLQAEGKQGTPVTAESFAKWRADKLAKRQAEAEARMKAESVKKGKGKALSMLSGKELFNYDATLFVDDDAALNVEEEQAMSLETQRDAAEEEAVAAAEAAKAQEEQMRLMEAQRLEIEARRWRDEEKRRVASLRLRLFNLGSIVINEIVFMEEDEEDLEPFDEVEEEDEEDDDDEDEDEDEDEDGEGEEEGEGEGEGEGAANKDEAQVY